MSRLRSVLGLIAGVLMIVNSVLHSTVGWASLKGRLEAAHAPADLIQALALSWLLAGVALLAFGGIVVAFFARGRPTGGLISVRITAVLFLAFGAWALVISRFDPFFLVFIVPGLLLAQGVFGPGASGRAQAGFREFPA